MVRSMPWKLALITLGALAGLASLAVQALADDSEGIVRISDQGAGQAAPDGHNAANCPQCQNGNGGGHNRQRTGHLHQFFNWFHPEGQCPHSPDYGYAPPGKMHTPHPQQVAYQKGFPDSWTGQQGAGGYGGYDAPRPVAIYMPTDTTQLGYYYQAVPRWLPRQGMIPPTPIPSQWHRELCQGQGGAGCRHCRNGQTANAHSENGPEPHLAPVQEAKPDPAPPTFETAPAPIPVQPMIDPAVPPEEPAPVQPDPAAVPLEKAELPNLQQIN